MEKICGHDREGLRKALEFANNSNLDAVSRGWPRPSDGGAILYDVHDPARLAEIMAELGRQCGFVAQHGLASETVDWFALWFPNESLSNESACVVIQFGCRGRFMSHPTRRLDMRTARTLALRWLSCKTAEEAMAALGSL